MPAFGDTVRHYFDAETRTLDFGGGRDAAQAEAVARTLGMADAWERVAMTPSAYDLETAIRAIETALGADQPGPHALDEAIASLSASDRDLILMRFYEDRDLEPLAAVPHGVRREEALLHLHPQRVLHDLVIGDQALGGLLAHAFVVAGRPPRSSGVREMPIDATQPYDEPNIFAHAVRSFTLGFDIR